MSSQNRLHTILEMSRAGFSLADIGTDHGHIAVQAIERGLYKKAIASDISGPSLQKAIREVQRKGLQEKIACRVGDGLSVLAADECDTVVIAGMGGYLIERILETTYQEAFPKTQPRLLLQPVQHTAALRFYLYTRGFIFEDERICQEDQRFYHIIAGRLDPSRALVAPSEIDCLLGPINLQNRGAGFVGALEREIRKVQAIYKKLPDSAAQAVQSRRGAIEALLVKLQALR